MERRNIFLQEIAISVQGDPWKGKTETCLWAPCLGPSTKGFGGMEVLTIAHESMNKTHLLQKRPYVFIKCRIVLQFRFSDHPCMIFTTKVFNQDQSEE